MYGLPESFDADIFVGRSVEQVCFAANQVAIHFDDDLHVVIQGEFSLKTAQGQVSGAIDDSVSPDTSVMPHHCLVCIIGAKVARADGTKEGTLTLSCESGEVLQLVDASPMYEAYTISHRGETWIV